MAVKRILILVGDYVEDYEVMVPYQMLLFPPLRALFLRLLGARIGPGVILHDLRFFNLYRRGLSGLTVARQCFIGDECLFESSWGRPYELRLLVVGLATVYPTYSANPHSDSNFMKIVDSP